MVTTAGPLMYEVDIGEHVCRCYIYKILDSQPKKTPKLSVFIKRDTVHLPDLLPNFDHDINRSMTGATEKVPF